MKVSNIKLAFNENLFVPEYTMNVSLSVEALQDGAAAVGSDELALIIGKEILQSISEHGASKKV
jgi:hypothetical protein